MTVKKKPKKKTNPAWPYDGPPDQWNTNKGLLKKAKRKHGRDRTVKARKQGLGGGSSMTFR